MRAAIIGGGIFGCTAALYAARAGYSVTLYEQSDDLLKAASGSNQFRLHMGYHYPRSLETALECQKGLNSFTREYGDAVQSAGSRTIYSIAPEGLTSVPDYLEFLANANLEYRVFPYCKSVRNVEHTILVCEPRLNIGVLRRLVKAKLEDAGVDVRLSKAMPPDVRSKYDQIIVAGYASTNSILQELELEPEAYQFEVVEKPVFSNPYFNRRTGVVILDGPFCSVDPMAGTDYHLLGHVEEAIWQRSFGTHPEIPEPLKPRVNQGLLIENPKFTRFERMRKAAEHFIPAMKNSRTLHIGSFFTIRTVQIGVEDTDERPTMVERLDDQVIRIFSGKMPSAVEAARSCQAMLPEVLAA